MTSKLTQPEIDEILTRTWDDQHLSRGERRALAQLVASPPELRLRVRRRSFELAKRFAADAATDLVIDWLEGVQKALGDASPPAPRAQRSEAHFAPRDAIYQRIIRALDQARDSADLAVFTITDDRITRAILAAHQRGVKVRVVSDNDKANDLGSDIERLAHAGLSVRIDRGPVHMHHKFALFDRALLLTGSYNWTRSAADDNAENVLVTTDPDLVAGFAAEFTHCWDHGEPY